MLADPPAVAPPVFADAAVAAAAASVSGDFSWGLFQDGSSREWPPSPTRVPFPQRPWRCGRRDLQEDDA
eukprot:1789249-Lingulodinium_polyedra.AAC.1